jgi:hypothetical protein
LLNPNPGKPVVAKRKSRFIGEGKLKIANCKLNICGCRFAPFFLQWKAPARKVWILVGWVELNLKCWVLHFNPTYENQAFDTI